MPVRKNTPFQSLQFVQDFVSSEYAGRRILLITPCKHLQEVFLRISIKNKQ
jgi:hypothetical protein